MHNKESSGTQPTVPKQNPNTQPTEADTERLPSSNSDVRDSLVPPFALGLGSHRRVAIWRCTILKLSQVKTLPDSALLIFQVFDVFVVVVVAVIVIVLIVVLVDVDVVVVVVVVVVVSVLVFFVFVVLVGFRDQMLSFRLSTKKMCSTPALDLPRVQPARVGRKRNGLEEK